MDEVSRTLWRGEFSVPFYWADPAGLMFFGNIYLAAQSQWEIYARSQPEVWSLWFGSENPVYPLRHSSAEHLHPMRFGETYEVHVQVRSTIESSFVLATEFSKDSKVHAIVNTVHTAYDTRLMAKGRIDPRLLFFFG
jgi:acyl-CoA thioesterase FadM